MTDTAIIQANMAITSIEWTRSTDGTQGYTWNPLRGCSKISTGCENCYAISMAVRFSGPGQPYEGFAKSNPCNWTGVVGMVPERMKDPLRWSRPRMVFVNSMSDLFHEKVPDTWIDEIFAVIALAPQHTFQILTKRAERMCQYFSHEWHRRVASILIERKSEISKKQDIQRLQGRSFGALTCGDHERRVLPNVWLGVSAEDQQRAVERIPWLLKTPAAVRFISAEPLIGEMNLGVLCDGLDWIIVGGESGPSARPCHVEWIRSLVWQCKEADVPVFVKQVGANPWLDPGELARRRSEPGYKPLHDAKGGDPSEWPEDIRVREFPRSAVPS